MVSPSQDTTYKPIDHARFTDPGWWRTAAIYQVYIRSFADGNGDGLGDIAGLRSKIPYLRDLGIDAVWINPWYPSPQADAGYDVADYRDIEAAFGTLDEAKTLIAELHDAGIKILLDIVPNHTSSDHRWFRAALAGDRAAQQRYVVRPGRGENGSEVPNNWQSCFGGPAWSPLPGEPGMWYLHMFAPEQPDLNWENPEVGDEFESILRHWFDAGVDGFRIDVAHGLIKAPGLPDTQIDPDARGVQPHPAWDNPPVHEIYRRWRKVADSYDPPRVYVGEIWVPTQESVARFVRPDELHMAFSFDFLRSPWNGTWVERLMKETLDHCEGVGTEPTWVLSNHDIVRVATRFSRPQPDGLIESDWDRGRWKDHPRDIAQGLRRARAAFTAIAALPGSVYIYQGEELGLEEVEDIPDELRQDPTFEHSGHQDVGRDGCRVPLPWVSEAPGFGFGPADGQAPWLPQPSQWKNLAVDAEEADPDSTLNLYRAVLRLRRERFENAGPVVWEDAVEGVVAYRRGTGHVWINTTSNPVPLPPGVRVLLDSSRPTRPSDAVCVPADATVYWTDMD